MESGLHSGDTVTGEVVSIKPYGAFVKLPNGEVGLVHISEVAEEYVKDVHNYLDVGQEVAVKVIGIHEEGKYNLSMRQLTRRERDSAHYSKQVREFREALESRREELRTETAWRRVTKEKQAKFATSHRSLRQWIESGRTFLEEASERGEERWRDYESLDL